MVKKARENIEAIKKDGVERRKGIGDMAVVLSDAGYCSEKNLEEMEGEKVDDLPDKNWIKMYNVIIQGSKILFY